MNVLLEELPDFINEIKIGRPKTRAKILSRTYNSFYEQKEVCLSKERFENFEEKGEDFVLSDEDDEITTIIGYVTGDILWIT